MSETTDFKAIRPLLAGDEVECDRAKITENAVYVRIKGVWTELGPTNLIPVYAMQEKPE